MLKRTDIAKISANILERRDSKIGLLKKMKHHAEPLQTQYFEVLAVVSVTYLRKLVNLEKIKSSDTVGKVCF